MKMKKLTFNSMISISEYFIPFTKIGTSLQEGKKIIFLNLLKYHKIQVEG